MEYYGVYKGNDILDSAFRSGGFNAVTFGDPAQRDLNKQRIYPYCHLSLLSANETGAVVTLTYQFAIMDVSDSNNLDPRESDDQFSRTDNEADILHDLEFKMAKILQGLKIADDVFSVSDALNMTVFYVMTPNKLIGYEGEIAITIQSPGVC